MIIESNQILESSSPVMTDIAIVGGGFAGCLAAIALGRDGHKVTLIDVNSANPALFRAEKISGDQLPLLQELGLLEDFKAVSTQVTRFINIRGRHIIDYPHVEEYGMLYPVMLDLLRKQVPSSVLFKQGRVMDIHTSDSLQRVVLANGETINARLVVLATGHSDGLRRKLGFESQKTHSLQTVCAGFTLRPPDSGFRFPALAVYGEHVGDGIDYMAIFPLGEMMRANLFMFSGILDPRVTALRNQGLPALFNVFPGLRPWIQDCGLASDVSIFPVELYRCGNVVRDGIVLISDAFKTSCPAVGSGLSCALVDVIRLRHHVSQWLKTSGMAAAKIAAFYSDPIKMARDNSALKLAFQRRNKIMPASRSHELCLRVYYPLRQLRDRLRRAVRQSVKREQYLMYPNPNYINGGAHGK